MLARIAVLLVALIATVGSSHAQTGVTLAGAVAGATPDVPDVPGPSATLFAAPFYTCLRNYYVSPTGNDANPGTSVSPWLTVQHADMAAGGRIAGDCVNVEPSTYANGAVITRGGNAATAAGYVVYRCTKLDACMITESAHGFMIAIGNNTTNYVVIDGFNLAALRAVTYGQGVESFDGNNGQFQSHHIWVLNNLISGFGQSGVQINQGDYVYVIHNAIYNNSNVTCDAQGSGISIVTPLAIPGAYQPTGVDLTFAPFHNVVSFNTTYGNILTQCGTASNPYNTDGNGIIMDTFAGIPGKIPVYPYQTLVAFNLTYNNGGKGIQIFATGQAPGNGITVANNVAYNNNLDPYDNGTDRAEINENTGSNDTFINNIAYAIRGAGYLVYNNDYVGDSRGETKSTFANNVGYCSGVSLGAGGSTPGSGRSCYGMYHGAIWTSGMDPGNPNWVALGSNFALQSNSPAIGYGQARTYLPAQAVDAGSCYHTLTSCPPTSSGNTDRPRVK
jgi:hypothetical protein